MKQVKKARLLLDVDGVLRDWYGTARMIATSFGNIPVKAMPEKPEDFDLEVILGDFYPKFKETCIDKHACTLLIHKLAPAYPGASVFYHYLCDKFDVDVVTYQHNEFTQALTIEWLRNNIVRFASPVIFNKKKKDFLVNYDVVVEDKSRTISDAWETGAVSLAVAQSHNVAKHSTDAYSFRGDLPSIIEFLENNNIDEVMPRKLKLAP